MRDVLFYIDNVPDKSIPLSIMYRVLVFSLTKKSLGDCHASSVIWDTSCPVLVIIIMRFSF